MKCPKCNNEIISNQSFCDNCGKDLKNSYIEEYAPRHIISISVYYAIIYLLVTIVQLALMAVYSLLTDKPIFDESNEILPQAENFIMIWNQIIIYFILFVSLSMILIKDIVYDLSKLRYNFKNCLKHAGIGIILMYAVNFFLNIINNKLNISGSSVNQTTIENMILNSGSLELFLYSIVLIIFAPIVEELIFRKSVFQILKKFKFSTTKKIIISGLLFGLLHVLSTIISYITTGAETMTIIIELVYSLPYIGTGFILSYIYAETNENIATPIIAHMFNNAVSCIAMFLLF